MPRSNAKAALIVAHPSHELRVHGWLERAHPLILVLTDGGGRAREPRLPATTQVLERAGARTGPVYGRLADLDLYRAMLDCNVDLFISIAEEMAEALVAEEIDYVVGDAAETYSSAHDVCRLLIDAAVEIAGRRSGREIANLDFLVIAAPEKYDPEINGSDEIVFWVHLDDAAFARKVAAARYYHPKLGADIEAALRGEKFHGVRRFSEPQLAGSVDTIVYEQTIAGLAAQPRLKAKIEQILGGVELDAFRVECLRPLRQAFAPLNSEPPYYELYGEKLVAAGRYTEVIRYREHLAPIGEALQRHAMQSG